MKNSYAVHIIKCWSIRCNQWQYLCFCQTESESSDNLFYLNWVKYLKQQSNDLNHSQCLLRDSSCHLRKDNNERDIRLH